MLGLHNVREEVKGDENLLMSRPEIEEDEQGSSRRYIPEQEVDTTRHYRSLHSIAVQQQNRGSDGCCSYRRHRIVVRSVGLFEA